MSLVDDDAGRRAGQARGCGPTGYRGSTASVDLRRRHRGRPRRRGSSSSSGSRSERPRRRGRRRGGHRRPGSSGRTWVIDPVDGTYNFVRGLHLVVLGPRAAPTPTTCSSARSTTLTTTRCTSGGPGLPSTRNGESAAPDRGPAAGGVLRLDLPAPPFYGERGRRAFGRVVAGVATLRMLGSGTMDRRCAIAQGPAPASLCQHSVAALGQAAGRPRSSAASAAPAGVRRPPAWSGTVDRRADRRRRRLRRAGVLRTGR